MVEEMEESAIGFLHVVEGRGEERNAHATLLGPVLHAGVFFAMTLSAQRLLHAAWERTRGGMSEVRRTSSDRARMGSMGAHGETYGESGQGADLSIDEHSRRGLGQAEGSCNWGAESAEEEREVGSAQSR